MSSRRYDAAQAVTLTWKGHPWQVTSGGMAGVCQGDPKNVTVDANGYLHLRISRDRDPNRSSLTEKT